MSDEYEETRALRQKLKEETAARQALSRRFKRIFGRARYYRRRWKTQEQLARTVHAKFMEEKRAVDVAKAYLDHVVSQAFEALDAIEEVRKK